MKCSMHVSARTSVILLVFKACAFFVVRSHIQTHEQNIQLGRQTEAGKMMVLGGMKHVKNLLSEELYEQLGLHRKPHHLMLQNNCVL